MNKSTENRIEKFHLRARFPVLLRAGAITVLSAVVLVVGIGFYFGSFRKEFRMKGLPAVLSENVIAVVEGYERKESENSRLRYSIKASKATTFDDKHQELENVVLDVYDDDGSGRFDKLRADKAIYVPDKEDAKNFKVFFAGNVVIDTRDNLNVKTDQLSYSKSEEKAEAEEYVEFSRENISGNSVGAVVKIEAKTLELLKDVEIFSTPGEGDSEFQNKDIKTAELRAGRAFVDQGANTIDLTGKVDALLIPTGANKNLERPTRITSNSAKAFIEEKQLRRIDLIGNARMSQEPGGQGRFTNASADRITAHVEKELIRLELAGRVNIESASAGNGPAKITSSTADYDRRSEIFDLKGGVVIESVSAGKPTTARALHAVYKQVSGEVLLTGDASVSQGSDVVGGDAINAWLYPDRSLKNADVSGNAYLRQVSPERKSEIRTPKLVASFAKGGKIKSAFATGGSTIEAIPLTNADYSKYSLKTPSTLEVLFRDDGKPASAKTEGRTTISLTASGSDAKAADKTLTADSVSTTFRNGSDELEGAVASGDAVLVIDPRSKAQGQYRTEISSPKFVCDFFAGNKAKSCTGVGRSTAVRKPLTAGRGTQTLEADRFVSLFDQKTQDVASLQATGSAKFKEAERNGIAEKIVYTASDETVRLSGGDPAIWDDSGRVRAGLIAWDVKNDRSSFSEKVSATYYSQRKARGATPFAKVTSPVFVSSETAAFDHRKDTAVFSGDARAWQEKNYVRGETIRLEQQTGRFYAEGNVRSLLYDAKRTAAGKRESVPVYAQSDSMLYINEDRILRYAGNVDIRQGTDRITSGTAIVYLDASNELKRTVAEEKVVITQPGRRATGEFAQYDAAEETIVLRGNPATVKDDERGSSEGREVTVRIRDNVIVGTGEKGEKGAGRLRSVYKLKDGKVN